MRGKTTFHIRWKLFFYDVIVFAVTSVFLLVLYEGPVKLTQRGKLQQMLLAFVCVFACRLVGKIYGQIWRYGGIQCYMRLVCTDCVAFLIYVILESVLPVAHISFPRLLALSTVNTMGALIMRMSYRYAYKCSNLETFSGKILAALLKIFAGIEVGGTRGQEMSELLWQGNCWQTRWHPMCRNVLWISINQKADERYRDFPYCLKTRRRFRN